MIFYSPPVFQKAASLVMMKKRYTFVGRLPEQAGEWAVGLRLLAAATESGAADAVGMVGSFNRGVGVRGDRTV